MLLRINHLIRAIILFVDAEIRLVLGLFVPHTSMKTKAATSSTTISSTTFALNKQRNETPLNCQNHPQDLEENHQQQQQQQQQNRLQYLENLRQSIDGTLREHDESWKRKWHEELPLVACLIVSIHHFFASRRFSWWFVPFFVADFLDRGLTHVMSVFAVSTSFNPSSTIGVVVESEQKENESPPPPPLVVRCNKSYGLLLLNRQQYKKKQKQQNEQESSSSKADAPVKEAESSASSPLPHRESEEEEKEIIKATVSSNNAAPLENKTRKPSFAMHQNTTVEQIDDDDDSDEDDGQQQQQKDKSRSSSKSTPTSSSSHSRTSRVSSRSSASKAPKNADDHQYSIDDNSRRRDSSSSLPPQQRKSTTRNAADSPEPMKISAETEDEKSTAGYRTDGYDTEDQESNGAAALKPSAVVGANDRESEESVHVRNDEEHKDLKRKLVDDDVGVNEPDVVRSSHSSSSKQVSREDTTAFVPENELSKETKVKNQEASSATATSLERTTYIWIDAALTRSTIPSWWTLFVNNTTDRKNTDDDESNIIMSSSVRHCQLVYLPESSDAEDCAHMVSPTSDMPSFPDVSGGALPSSSNNNNSNNSKSTDALAAARKRSLENSTRVLTEALAEGIVSAWSLTAQGRLDVLDQVHNEEGGEDRTNQQNQQESDKKNVRNHPSSLHQKICFVTSGHEAAAALLLAATSTSDEMRSCFAGCIFIDALSDFSYYLHRPSSSSSNSKHHHHQQQQQLFFAPSLNDGPFSSISDSRDITLFEEMWKRIRSTASSSSSSSSASVSGVDDLNNNNNTTSSLFSERKIDLNTGCEIVEAADLLLLDGTDLRRISPSNNNSSSFRRAKNVSNSGLDHLHLNHDGNNNHNNSNHFYNSSPTMRLESITTSPITKSALKKKSSNQDLDHQSAGTSENNNNNNYQQNHHRNTSMPHRPVVFRVPSVADWSQLLETTSQHSGRDTPSYQQQQQPSSSSSSPSSNNNTPTSINKNKIIGARNVTESSKFYAQNNKNGIHKNSSSSELFAAPSIALKIDENNMIEAASGVARDTKNRFLSSDSDLVGMTYVDGNNGGGQNHNNRNENEKKNNNNKNNNKNNVEGDDPCSPVFATNVHRGDTLTQFDAAFYTSMEDCSSAFDQKDQQLQQQDNDDAREKIKENGNENDQEKSSAEFDTFNIDERNNNSKKNVISQQQQQQQQQQHLNDSSIHNLNSNRKKTHLSELAHKTDQFFRNDMRSVAARVQLNHGTFVFLNTKKNSTSQNVVKKSSLNSFSSNNNNKKDGNNINDQSPSSNHGGALVAPGTKLIQTWIRRIERPKEFEGLITMKKKFTSSSVENNYSNQNHQQHMSSFSSSSLPSFNYNDKNNRASSNSLPRHDQEEKEENESEQQQKQREKLAMRIIHEKRNERFSRGQEVLFVKLPMMNTSSANDYSSSVRSNTANPLPSDQVAFLFILWQYLLDSSRILLFFNRVYRKIVVEVFWGRFVLSFLMGSEKNNNNEKAATKEKDSLDDTNDDRKSSQTLQVEKPLLLSLVENLGSQF